MIQIKPVNALVKTDRTGKSVLSKICSDPENYNLVDVILKSNKFPATKERLSPLIHASANNCIDICRRILFDENIGGEREMHISRDLSTPVHEAALRGHVELCDLLLTDVPPKFFSPFSVRDTDCDLWTPLHYAVQRGDENLAVVQSLVLKHGAKVYPRNKNGSTPLYIAAQRKNAAKVCEFLLQNGADPNQQNHHGWTPFLTAVRNKRYENCKVLLLYGANKSLRPYDAMSFETELGLAAIFKVSCSLHLKRFMACIPIALFFLV